MDRFVSHYTLRLDAKGRVSIPAPFRAVLARDGFEGLYCYPTLDRPALDAGGNALLKEIETLIARFSPYSEEREQFSAALYGTSEVLKIDGEGRAILTEPLKTSCRHQGRGRLRRPGPQVSDLGARALSRGTRGGHREGPRAQEAAGLPGSGGRSARSTGMMTGSDSGHAVAGGLARHIPVLGRPAVEFLDVRAGGVYVDATFGAGGYTREILAAANCSVIALDRDQSAIARGADLVQAAQAAARAGGGHASPICRRWRAAAATTPSTAWSSTSASPRCSSTRPSADFPFATTVRSTCAWARAGPSAADVVAAASERDLAAIIAILGEERHARAVARAIVAARAEAPIRTTRALADIVARVVHARPGAIHPGHPHVPGAAHLRQRGARRTGRGLRRGRAGAQAGRPAGGRDLPFARRPHRQVVSRRAQPAQRAFAPSSRSGASCRHVSRADQAADRAGRGGDRRQSARALGQAAGGRAHRCADRHRAHRRACFRACRR